MNAIISMVLALSLMNGCSTMTKESCQEQDWQLYASQKFSNSPSSFNSINAAAHDACKEHQITPDLEQLKLGYMQGVRSYCTKRNIWEQTLKGETVNISYCPSSMRKDLQQVLTSAKDVHALEQLEEELIAIENSINSLQHEMYGIENELQAKYAAKAPQHEIDALIAKLNAKRGEILNAQNDLSKKRLKAIQMRRRANKYQQYNS